MYLSQAALIDRLLEQDFAGILRSENLISNDLRFNPGKERHKWEQLRPCSTPLDYKVPKLLLVDSPAQPDLALVHWMQIAVGTLMYILNSRPDLTHSVHQMARFVNNPGSAHVKALDHILRYLAGTGDLCLIVGNWTPVDRRFLVGFHLYADSSHKNVELDFPTIIFVALVALECLLWVLFCFLVLLFRIRCLPPRVRLSIMLILLPSKILNMCDFYSVILVFLLMTLILLSYLLIVSRPWPCLRAPRIVLVQSILTLQWLWRVITFNAGELLWNIVLQPNRLLICGPSS
jgi:hypothetical protein